VCVQARRAGAGKSAPPGPRGDEEERLRPDRTGVICGREKPLVSSLVTVPQTDTGGRAQDAQARERTLVKELGKMAP